MRPLAEFLTAFRPDCRVLTLSKRDLETLRKYPEAAQRIHEFTISPTTGVLYWRGFELHAEPTPPTSKPQLIP